jgi:hypothetical protein
MKAETAVITIDGKATLKVRLQAETKEELEFLKEALEKCGDYKLSAAMEQVRSSPGAQRKAERVRSTPGDSGGYCPVAACMQARARSPVSHCL